MKRRDFFKTAAICGVASTLPKAFAEVKSAESQETSSMNQIPLTTSAGTRKGDMLYRTLGRTGEKVSAIGMGGFHIAQHSLTEDDSIRLVRSAIDRGITFMDNSWDYNEGQSEIRMGKALKDGYREKVFLMTKIDGRTKETATRQIDTCLERLQTDHIDLVQHHEIIRFDDPIGSLPKPEPTKRSSPRKSRQDSLHWIHRPQRSAHPSLHAESSRGTRLPLRHRANAAERNGRALSQLRADGAARTGETGNRRAGMKSMGDSVILKSKTVSPIECLHYALSLPTSVVITGIDKPEILDQAFEAAKSFQPMNREQITQLLAKTKEVAMAGKYELFKTSSHFDSTAKHPDWLGGDAPDVQKLAPPSA